VTDDHEEPNRVFGIPLRPPGSPGREGEEPQRVLGFPVDWFGPLSERLPDWLTHPVRELRQRVRRRPSP
jgi:hypothetical protein